MEYLLRFDFDIHYIKGISNKVVDTLSHYYESATSEDVHGIHKYVNTNIRIDKDHDNLPQGRLDELELDQFKAMRYSERLQNKQRLVQEATEA